MTSSTKTRLARLRERLKGQEFDTFLVSNQENRRYLSGFTAEDGQCDESAGGLFINETRQMLATDSRYETQARMEAPDFEIFRYDKGIAVSLPEILDSFKTVRLGFESSRTSFLQYQRCQEQLKEQHMPLLLIPSEGLVESLRVVKDAGEVEAIALSLALSEAVFADCVKDLAPGVTEKELAWALEKGLRQAGAEAVAFPPIVASGQNAALPHAVPTDRKIREGEPVLFDWGARLNGYCSDISRTLILGKPDETFGKVYVTVHDALSMAVGAIRPGVSTQEVDRIARDHIASKGFGGFFGHGLGHGVGLATHEKPHLSPLRPMTLEPGMVTTVEPGIYLPEWGGVRLENMVVVTEYGSRVLNGICLDPNWSG